MLSRKYIYPKHVKHGILFLHIGYTRHMPPTRRGLPAYGSVLRVRDMPHLSYKSGVSAIYTTTLNNITKR